MAVRRYTAIFSILLISILMLVGRVCEAKEVEITFSAHIYTPGIVTGDIPKPLEELGRIVDEWEKLHPGVKVKFIKQPVGDYRTWVITQLKGNVAPDIMNVQSEWCNESARYGWFLPLNEYLEKPNPYVPGNKQWADLFYKDATDARRAPNGQLYVIPVDQVETGIYYNKDIFREVGVEPPKTWAEFMEVSEKIQDAGYIPFLCDGQVPMQLSWVLSILQDQLWNDKLPLMDVRSVEAGGFPGVDTQEFVRAYKKGIWSVRDERNLEVYRIIKEWSQYWNKDFLASTGDRIFRVGKAAMFWEGSWSLPRMMRDPLRTFELGVFPCPRLTEETSPLAPDIQPRGVGGATSLQYCVTNHAIANRKAELAVDLLRYITAPRNLGPMVAEAEMYVPNSPGVKGSPILAPFEKTLEAGHILFGGELFDQQYADQAFRVLQSYLGGQYTLDELADHLERFAEPACERVILQNPQWNFDESWDILKDKDTSEIAEERESPPFVKYIPWTLFGALLLGASGVTVANRRQIWRGMKRNKSIYPFIIPTFVLLAIFNYYPIFSALYHSLFDWKGGGEALWIGLANYRELFGDVILKEASINALKLLGVGILVSITVPLAAAELIFHLKSQRAQYIYRVLFIIPMVVPGIVMLLIWGFIYGYDMGLVNNLFQAIGLGEHTQVWLGDPKIALYSLMFIGFPWIGGFSLLIYYAGLQNISQDVLDSCKIDGAYGLKRIRMVDIPLIMGQIKLLVVLGFINGIQGFQTQLLLTEGGPGYSTMVPGLHLYQNAISYDRMGYACAIGVILFIVIMGLTYINMKYLRSSTEYEAK